MGARAARAAARLQVHDPVALRATGAVLVRDRAAPARPVLPPDPFEVVHLEDEEGDDPEEDVGLRHDLQRIGIRAASAMGRAAHLGPPGVLREAGAGYQRRAPARPIPPVKRLISQISGITAATMKSQWTTKPTPNASSARMARTTSSSMIGFASLNSARRGGLRRENGRAGAAVTPRSGRARARRRPAGSARARTCTSSPRSARRPPAAPSA